MNIGRFTIEQLSEGFFELFEDGSFKKMDPSRLNNPGDDTTLGRYSSALGIDPLLISDGHMNILVDTGLGWGLDHKSSYTDTSNVITNLEIFGIAPDDITIVILTHLHYDHSAGCTYVDEDFKTQPVFPNARYIVQKKEWEYALSEQMARQNSPGADYRLDELYRLKADTRFDFIDGNHSPAAGISLIHSGGHTPGHQVAKIQDCSKTAYFLGDLIPTEYHLNHYAMKMIDHSPVEAKKAKTLILKEAFREQAQLFFYHSLFHKTGRLSKDRHRNYILKEIRKR
jgi:glyoxylase-like metal-dependent hydrolase (beta-lactamase superfamily II)